jgi:hypothetical protein
MEVQITKGTRFYHFQTLELKKVCPKCKREYTSPRLCLNCLKKGQKIELVEIPVTHLGKISVDLTDWSCDCIFSSWFRFSEFWKEKPNSKCKHYQKAMSIIKKE